MHDQTKLCSSVFSHFPNLAQNHNSHLGANMGDVWKDEFQGWRDVTSGI